MFWHMLITPYWQQSHTCLPAGAPSLQTLDESTTTPSAPSITTPPGNGFPCTSGVKLAGRYEHRAAALGAPTQRAPQGKSVVLSVVWDGAVAPRVVVPELAGGRRQGWRAGRAVPTGARVTALAIRDDAVVMRGEGPEGARIDKGAPAVLARLERQPVMRAAPNAVEPDESPVAKLVNLDRSCATDRSGLQGSTGDGSGGARVVTPLRSSRLSVSALTSKSTLLTLKGSVLTAMISTSPSSSRTEISRLVHSQ
eukprot:COSAG04_NODE_1092_length_8322_cov_1.935547_7_plen_253_part_00